ncbi:uncharacterized protein LOC127790297 [Diospyros lotus]|uniref:uncharacterized protein LOC127790297 n=1 Tax=Diospyros lotus TaxID=55363 RepID=UPI00224DEF9F|nr:uncharacterized protein LOC127790297 [Diospyros lotus]
MDQGRGKAVLIHLFCLLLLIFLSSAFGDDGEQGRRRTKNPNVEEVLQKRPPSLLEMLLNPAKFTTAPPAAADASFRDKVKALANLLQAYLFPPNLDFRGSDEVEETSSGSRGEKVKEAVAKSLGKTRAAVEDSARSAAKLAGDSLHKLMNKEGGARGGVTKK